MNRHLMIALICTAGLIALFLNLPQPDQHDRPHAVTDALTDNDADRELIGPVRLFDGERMLEDRYVLIRDGRIESIADSAPEGLQSSVETDGRTLMPGLIDAHTHSWGSALSDALRFGVTTELDMFTDHRFAAEQRSANGALDGPLRADLFSAGTLITAPGGHGTEYGMEIPVLDKPEDAAGFVTDRIAEGSDYIKLVYNAAESKRQAFPSISRQSMQAVIRAAHDQGKLAVVHVSDHLSAEHVVEAGADGLVHTFMDQTVSDALLERMLEQGVFIIPTLAVSASVVNGSGAEGLLDDPVLAELSNGAIRASLGSRFPDFGIPDQALVTALDNTRRMHRAGIAVLAGTDAPNPGTAHGISMHREMALLVESGLSPLESLAAATRIPATQFDLPDRGLIREGMLADLLLVEGRPDEDILHTRQIVQVWKTGRRRDDASGEPVAAALILPENGLVSDFSGSSLQTDVGEGFVQTSDQMMNGTSESTVSWSEQDGGVLQVRGQVDAGFAFPWSGAFYQAASPEGEMLDLSDRTTISFRVRGTPGRYTLMLFTNGVMMPFRTPFEVIDDWTEVRVPLAVFTGAERSEVVGFAWVRTDPIDSFEMVLDDVRIQ